MIPAFDGENGKSPPERILVIDDDENVREMLRLFLEKKGYEVISAENGIVALKKIQQAIPDLILLDVIMPEMDGYTFYKEIKKGPATKDIPVLIVTARSMMEDSFTVMGVDGFLVKPVLPEKLLIEIERLVSNRSIRDQAPPDVVLPISRRILLIGTDRGVLDEMIAVAQRMGFEAQAVNGGSKTVSTAVNVIPEVIFIDVQLNDMSAGEVVESLRRVPRFEETPIIGYSYYDVHALADPNVRRKMLRIEDASLQLIQCGATRYIGRYHPQLFVQTVREFKFHKSVS